MGRDEERILEVVEVMLPRPRNVLTVPDCDGFARLHSHLQQLLFGASLGTGEG
jgi:hypothetical protein